MLQQDLCILDCVVCSAGSSAAIRGPHGTPPCGPAPSVERSQGQRPSQQADERPTSPMHVTQSAAEVKELRQQVASLQLHNSQLAHLSKQQQATISQLEVCSLPHYYM